jgi:hypothetical protein
MGRYAQIENEGDVDLVVNVILWDGEAPYPSDNLVALDPDSPVGIGWTFENDEWIAPPEPDFELPE